MSCDDIGLWTDIERDAEPFLKIGDHVFRKEFGGDLEAIGERCFIVIDPKDLGVGTISAWYDRDFHGRYAGRVHWLAMRPSCQGKGVAKAALGYALHQLAKWHQECYLATSTGRVGAIAMYLNFGFVPDLSTTDAVDAWKNLAARLKHPALERALAEA